MKEFKGTTGEWIVDEDSERMLWITKKDAIVPICQMNLGKLQYHKTYSINEEDRANAKLIAASKNLLGELLMARKDLIEVGFDKNSHRITAIDQALSKALD